MASFPVTITVESTPPVEVFGTFIPYEDILNSLGSFYYLIERIFIEALIGGVGQGNQPLQFNRYNANGLVGQVVISPAINPYGKQAVIMVDVSEYELVADSRLIMSFDILPLAAIRFTFYTKRGSIQEGLNAFDKQNYQRALNV